MLIVIGARSHGMKRLAALELYMRKSHRYGRLVSFDRAVLLPLTRSARNRFPLALQWGKLSAFSPLVSRWQITMFSGTSNPPADRGMASEK